MKFTPILEEEINESRLWPQGDYKFEIASAEDTVSKKGNEMIKLILNVQNNEGNSIVVYDYLLEMIEYKLRHCAEACSLFDKYKEGVLKGSDFEGKTGTLKLMIQEDKTGQYSDKNSVKDYVVDKNLLSAQEKHTIDKGNAYVKEKELDDAIPF